jgi:SEC-C motif-containing protein
MSFGQAARGEFPAVPDTARCPCGTGESFGACCRPLHAGDPAPSAERLMRARYSAFVVGDRGYLRDTWHGSTRPERVELDPGIRWTGLEIVDVVEQGDRAVVEFSAHFRDAEGVGVQHERSRFARRAGKWFYVDAEA